MPPITEVLPSPPEVLLPRPAPTGLEGSAIELRQDSVFTPLEAENRLTSVKVEREGKVILEAAVNEAPFIEEEGKYKMVKSNAFSQLSVNGQDTRQRAIHLALKGKGPVENAYRLKTLEPGDILTEIYTNGREVKLQVTAIEAAVDPNPLTRGNEYTYYTCVIADQPLEDDRRFVVVASVASQIEDVWQSEQDQMAIADIKRELELIEAGRVAEATRVQSVGTSIGQRPNVSEVAPIVPAWAIAVLEQRRQALRRRFKLGQSLFEGDDDDQDQGRFSIS